jgi:hypothetical protein
MTVELPGRDPRRGNQVQALRGDAQHLTPKSHQVPRLDGEVITAIALTLYRIPYCVTSCVRRYRHTALPSQIGPPLSRVRRGSLCGRSRPAVALHPASLTVSQRSVSATPAPRQNGDSVSGAKVSVLSNVRIHCVSEAGTRCGPQWGTALFAPDLAVPDILTG